MSSDFQRGIGIKPAMQTPAGINGKFIRGILLKSLVVFIILSGAVRSGVCADAVRTPIDIIRNGEESDSVVLLLIEKMGYLPADTVARNFDASLEYDADSGKITFSWDDRLAEFEVGSDSVTMEGIERKMMKSPLIFEDKPYIPLEAVITRAFQSASGASVKWSFPHRILWISYEGNITDIRSYTYDGYTRFVIELTGEMEYSHTDRSRRFTVEIKDGQLISPALKNNISDDVIRGFQVRETRRGMEFILSLSQHAGERKIMKLPSPPRLVVDIENKKAGEARPSAESLPPAPAGPPSRGKADIRDINLIVIDPGHGGRDPGAIGPRGVKEKDVVLGISRKLAQRIKERLKIRAVLTRTGDYFVPLEKRTRIANEREADVFISIHANASLNPDSRGFEVYFLSEEASDREAAAVARRENSVMAMEERPVFEDRVSRILWSLTMNQFMNESSELCSFVNSRVLGRTGLTGRGVKQAGFHVMRGARMPSILVEAGFISNRQEEAQLNDPEFQMEIADAICDALEEYRDWVRNR